MGDISKNFSYDEFVVSEDFPELAAQITLTKFDKYKIFWLVSLFLQPLRNQIELPIEITSSKRDHLLNKAVKGVPNSDHRFTGLKCAADFKIHSKKDGIKYELISDFWYVVQSIFSRWGHSQFIKQLIFYLPSAGNFVHVSLRDSPHKIFHILYCASRGERQYFTSYEEAERYARSR